MRTPIQGINDSVEGCLGCGAVGLVGFGGSWLLGLLWKRIGVPEDLTLWFGMATLVALWCLFLAIDCKFDFGRSQPEEPADESNADNN